MVKEEKIRRLLCIKDADRRKVKMEVRQIRIDFNVTPQISRYVYVYAIESEKAAF